VLAVDPWRPVGAALEYWFFWTSWPAGALLVDRIVRRGAVADEVRVSYACGDTAGMTCHYWGRRLPDRWLWLSANDFDRPGIAIELGC
jgi:hypothetical protein